MTRSERRGGGDFAEGAEEDDFSYLPFLYVLNETSAASAFAAP